jgi:NAD(P)H-dependent FMN reductase
MKVLGISSNNNEDSIHNKLLQYALSLFENVDIERIDLNEFKVTVNPKPAEKNSDFSERIKILSEKFDTAVLVVISIAEEPENTHFNTVYSALEKLSNGEVFAKQPLLLLTTSIHNDEGKSLLESATKKFNKAGSPVWETFSLPNFHDHFDKEGKATLQLRLPLIRKINKVVNDRLKIKDKNFFTCGIDPERDPCGDAIEY